MNIPEKLTKEEARVRLTAIDADPDAIDWGNVRAELAGAEAEAAAHPDLVKGLPVEKTLAILRAHVAYLDAASEAADSDVSARVDGGARTALLDAAHDALAALKRFEAVMAEHEDAWIGATLALPLMAIRSSVNGTLGMIEGRLPPVERTPETVLRSMLRVYEAAELDAVMRGVGGEMVACFRGRIQDIREALACHVVHGADPSIHCVMHVLVSRDYEARLRGDRPLDAPPMG